MEEEIADYLNVDIIARINGMLNSLSPSEKTVGEYILDNHEQIPLLTLSEVAANSGVSDTTAVRFFKSLGFARWFDLKIALVGTTRSVHDIYKEVELTDSIRTIASKVIQGSILALKETEALLDDQGLTNAVDLLVRASRILVVGAGTSGPIANDLFSRLFRLGINVKVETDAHLQVMQCALLTSSDVVVAISHTGESNNTLNAARVAKRRGCAVICITGNRLSELARLSDVVLLAISHELFQETTASRIAQHAMAHALYIGLAVRCKEKCIENERAIWDAIGYVNALRKRG
jgi:RpiR family transcriptional regulator, carbohydrate utilization regulator